MDRLHAEIQEWTNARDNAIRENSQSYEQAQRDADRGRYIAEIHESLRKKDERIDRELAILEAQNEAAMADMTQIHADIKAKLDKAQQSTSTGTMNQATQALGRRRY